MASTTTTIDDDNNNNNSKMNVKQLEQEMRDRNRMLYFGYGSNMLKQRVLIKNPSMELVGVGRLEGYRFCFAGYSTRWDGAVANLIEDPQSHVYGVVYSMDLNQLDALNKQESGFDLKKVEIDLRGIGKIECGVYIQNQHSQRDLIDKFYEKNGDEKTIAPSSLPSYAYKMTCMLGATEQGVPQEYVEKTFRSWPDNGRKNTGPKDIRHYFN